MNLEPTQMLILTLMAIIVMDKLFTWVLIFIILRGQRVQTFPQVPVRPVVPSTPDVVPPVVIPSQTQSPIVIPPIVPPVVVHSGSDFDRCLAVTLREEGGNDLARGNVDRTSRGIEQIRDWDVWRKTHPGLPVDVFDAPNSEIKAIYKKNYWEPLFCDSLPNGVDLVVFDHGVLGGIGTSARLLQTLVGTNVDGKIGPLTIAAAAAADPVSLVGRFCDERLAYYKSREGWSIYGKGWTNRVLAVRKDALALAAEAPRPMVTSLPPAANIPAPVSGSTVLQHNVWPTQVECPSFYGNSEAAIRTQLVTVHVPWLMNGKTQTIEIHKKCAESLTRIVNFIWEKCGKSQDQIHTFGYDVFDGSFNWRPIRGGSGPSVHSYGAAIDWDAVQNSQLAPANKTKFKEDSLITTAFETEGWIWGGRWVTPRDAMHFQAARVR